MTTADELRHLAQIIDRGTRSHPAYQLAAPWIRTLVDHLRAEASHREAVLRQAAQVQIPGVPGGPAAGGAPEVPQPETRRT